MAKLHNLAFDIFVKGHGIDTTGHYSKFENIVYWLDKLGNDLLVCDLFETEVDRLKVLENNIGAVISSLVVLAKECDVDMERIRAETMEALS